MAAPLKDSLDYFPLDCNFFEDKTIKGLRAKFGNNGIVVYLYLLCMIYRDNGYYTELDEDLLLDVTDTMHISEEEVNKIIDHMTSRNMFDNSIVETYSVLTSRSIQRRFQKGKTRAGSRRKVEVNPDYWLLSEQETEPWIDVQGHVHATTVEHHDILNEQSEQKPVKESKVKKSKVKEKIPKKNYADAVSLTDDEYAKLMAKHSKPFVDKCIEVLNNYKLSSGKKYKSDYHAILNWVVERVTKDHPNLASQLPTPQNVDDLFENPWGDMNG